MNRAFMDFCNRHFEKLYFIEKGYNGLIDGWSMYFPANTSSDDQAEALENRNKVLTELAIMLWDPWDRGFRLPGKYTIRGRLRRKHFNDEEDIVISSESVAEYHFLADDEPDGLPCCIVVTLDNGNKYVLFLEDCSYYMREMLASWHLVIDDSDDPELGEYVPPDCRWFFVEPEMQRPDVL